MRSVRRRERAVDEEGRRVGRRLEEERKMGRDREMDVVEAMAHPLQYSLSLRQWETHPRCSDPRDRFVVVKGSLSFPRREIIQLTHFGTQNKKCSKG